MNTQKYISQDYYIQHNIGNAKYCLNYFVGDYHADNSKQYRLKIFKNKKALNNFIKHGLESEK